MKFTEPFCDFACYVLLVQRSICNGGCMAKEVNGYSGVQIALHWIVVVLIAFQFLAHNAIEASWRAFRNGEIPSESAAILTSLHVGVGMAVLLCMLCRVYLRLTRGAPSPPADEPRLLKIVSEAVHRMIYVLLLLLPISGAVAWFFGASPAAGAHVIMEKLLLGLIAAHIGGALFQHLIRRSDVVVRMFAPERPETVE